MALGNATNASPATVWRTLGKLTPLRRGACLTFAARCDRSLSTHGTVAHGYPVHELWAVLRRHPVRRRGAGWASRGRSARDHGDGNRGRRQERRPAVAALRRSARNTMRDLLPSAEVLSRVRVPPAPERTARFGSSRAGNGAGRGDPGADPESESSAGPSGKSQ